MVVLSRALAVLCCACANAVEPNPPVWPDSVKVISESDDMTKVQAALDDSWAKNGGQVPTGEPSARYSPYRFTFMFKPGKYSVNAPIGYYVHVVGAGATPSDVIFEGNTGPHVPCNNQLPQPGQLVTFWRTAERFKRVGNMDWFVSQAAPLRDLVVTGDLNLHKTGSHGSGGYTANSRVEGNVNGGGQQQWFTRNLYVGKKWKGIAWNTLFVGAQSEGNEEHMMQSRCGLTDEHGQTVVVDKASHVAEKPFISVDPQDSNKFNLNIPPGENNRKGPKWDQSHTVVPFEQVYVTKVTDTADVIQAKLDAGLHIVVSPGIYPIDKELHITNENTVFLCLGLASLQSTAGNTVIQVKSGVGGVRVAGCVLEASPSESDFLMRWGTDVADTSTGKNGYIFDLFTRVGGPAYNGQKGNVAAAKVMLQIDSNDITADHLWLWRGDHYLNETTNTDASHQDKIGITKLGDLKNANGLVVSGQRVRVYNLAVEHSDEDQVIWKGDDGEVYFFQCEIPYDVDSTWAAKGYVAYRVADNVKTHKAYGIGAYSYFNYFTDVFMENAMMVPAAVLPTIYQPFIVKLWGYGGIKNTINGFGTHAGNLEPDNTCDEDGFGSGDKPCMGVNSGPRYTNNNRCYRQAPEPAAPAPTSAPAPAPTPAPVPAPTPAEAPAHDVSVWSIAGPIVGLAVGAGVAWAVKPQGASGDGAEMLNA